MNEPHTRSMQVAIYYACPLDEADDDDFGRDKLEGSVPEGVVVFFPGSAYTGAGVFTAKRLDHLNRSMIQACDGVLADFGAGQSRPFGTIREIEFARRCGKPVVVVSALPVMSLTAWDVYQQEDAVSGLNRLVQAVREQRDRPSMQGLLLRFGAIDPEEVDDDDD